MMLTELCHELNNWFDKKHYIDHFFLSDGIITTKSGENLDLKSGQYFRIIGSIFNDGVHLNPAADLIDEEFEGAIWTMAIPQEFISLATEIEAWQAKYGGIDSEAMSPFSSESFGGYSYSKSGGGASDGTSNAGTWRGVFASRLNRWRKIR